MLEALLGSAEEGARALQTVPQLGSWSPTNMRLSFDWLVTTEGNAQASSLLCHGFRFPSSAGGEKQSVVTPQAVRGWTHPPCRHFKIHYSAGKICFRRHASGMCGVGRVGCWLIARLLCVVQARRRREHICARPPGCC
jgi:hypothetical protein